MYRLFIIEDDRGIAEAISDQAQMWGLEVKCAENFRNILAEFAEFNPHLILIDIGLPFLTDIIGAARYERAPAYP